MRVVFPDPLTPIRAVRTPGLKAPDIPDSNWCITKELALDRREWKLAIHVSEP
jgi:hypothetical protein